MLITGEYKKIPNQFTDDKPTEYKAEINAIGNYAEIEYFLKNFNSFLIKNNTIIEKELQNG
jgi:hypothetical protein